ncbi:hypothetical protein GGS24DRAFT_458749 [Hypoxylon argillaceum]|nr:hypothetical protein GGS24DRAFT_458749 [Hypoxylon argillaceum]
MTMADIRRAYHCDCDCKKGFATPKALAQHRRDSPRHRNNQMETSTPDNTTPTLIVEQVVNRNTENPVEFTNPPPYTPAAPTTTSSQKQSTDQKKKKKKRGDQSWWRARQANKSTQSREYSPLRRYYNPNWELEYQISGPDHTQCSSDCDWCGMCAIREPY